MAPLLNHKNLIDYLPFLQIVTRRLVEKWRSKASNDAKSSHEVPKAIAINRDIRSYTMDIIGLIAFDQDFDCVRQTNSQHAIDIQKIFDILQIRAISPVWYWRIPLIGQYLDGGGFVRNRLEKFLGQTIECFQKVNDKNKGAPSFPSREHHDRGLTYLDKVLSQQEFMSETQIMGNLMTMFIAGSETTGSTITTCLWKLLAHNGKNGAGVFRELVHEARQLPGLLDSANTINVEQVRNALPKTRAFFYEINRFYGAGPSLILRAAKKINVANLEFPEATHFYIDFEYLGCLEGGGIPNGPNGEAPDTFCSRRWLMPDENIPNKWHAVKPSLKTGVPLSSGFGTGARICPGQHLAELEVVYCLACILQNFDISLKPNHPHVQMVTNFTVCPDKDIELCLREVAAVKL